jgi:hypothetical protein
MGSVGSLLVALLLALPTLAAANDPAFEPRKYVRTTGAPNAFSENFRACGLDREFRLIVENGPEGLSRVSSGTVTLNGVELVHERDLNQQIATIARRTRLKAHNSLVVGLAGTPGGAVRVNLDPTPRCLEVAITEPPPGATVPAGPLLVRGTVRGLAGFGVAVNGMPAFVEGQTFVGLVPVDPSVAELVTVARAPDGTTADARQALSVVPGPEGLVQLRAGRPGGLAPLATGFFLASLVGISRVALDLGDGRPEFEGPSLDRQTFTYTRPGVYAPAVRVTDAQGQVHAAVTLVQVFDPVALDWQLQAVWNGFKDAVRVGDLAKAAEFLHGDTRAAYRAQLELLSPGTLANIDQIMTTIDLVEAGFGGAEYEMLRNRDGHTLSFAVWFQLDRDGLWRLRRF